MPCSFKKGSNAMMIVQETNGQIYAVKDYADAALSHVWEGIPVKRMSGYRYAVKKNAKPVMVRKAAATVLSLNTVEV